ncbi:hypothetical protein, partial [Fibrobacter sp.]|uniref:hypothetical protein n=1 Tax=Fibrobacter sp. TaxID=35828 RepID=UPI00262207F5
DVSEMLSRLLAGFISLLFILVPLDVEFSFFSTKEPRFYRLKISDRLTPKGRFPSRKSPSSLMRLLCKLEFTWGGVTDLNGPYSRPLHTT